MRVRQARMTHPFRQAEVRILIYLREGGGPRGGADPLPPSPLSENPPKSEPRPLPPSFAGHQPGGTLGAALGESNG